MASCTLGAKSPLSRRSPPSMLSFAVLSVAAADRADSPRSEKCRASSRMPCGSPGVPSSTGGELPLAHVPAGVTGVCEAGLRHPLGEAGVEVLVALDGVLEEAAHAFQAGDRVLRAGVPLLVGLAELRRGRLRLERCLDELVDHPAQRLELPLDVLLALVQLGGAGLHLFVRHGDVGHNFLLIGRERWSGQRAGGPSSQDSVALMASNRSSSPSHSDSCGLVSTTSRTPSAPGMGISVCIETTDSASDPSGEVVVE